MMKIPNWRTSYSISRTIIVLALTIVVYLIPAPEGLTQSGKNALAALVFTASIFTLQPVSLPFSSLLVSIALVFLGVANAQQAFEPLSRPIIILILGSLCARAFSTACFMIYGPDLGSRYLQFRYFSSLSMMKL